MDIGGMLRTARLAWGLSLKEVEERSVRLAEQWGKPAYRISSSWLDRVERENRDLSAAKLIVLASLYGLTIEQMLALCPSPSEGLTVLERNAPNSTVLLNSGPVDDRAKQWLPDTIVTEAPPELTMLLPTTAGVLPVQYRRGIIGQRDRTLEPMVRAGSIVLIDVTKRSIAGRKQWTHEFDRPIYFLLTHSGYVSGFCELDKDSEWLTLIPHPLSYETSRRWRFKKEIEVVGTVSAVFSRRVA